MVRQSNDINTSNDLSIDIENNCNMKLEVFVKPEFPATLTYNKVICRIKATMKPTWTLTSTTQEIIYSPNTVPTIYEEYEVAVSSGSKVVVRVEAFCMHKQTDSEIVDS